MTSTFHMLLQSKHWDVLKALLKYDSEVVLGCNDSFQFVLSTVLEKDLPDEEFIQMLCDALRRKFVDYKAGLGDYRIIYPFHSSSLKLLDSRTVVSMLRLYAVTNMGGNSVDSSYSSAITPLHLAMTLKLDTDILHGLLNYVDISALREKTNCGNTALHLALLTQQEPSIISELIKIDPLLPQTKSTKGYLALHLALIRFIPVEVTKLILLSYRNAIKEPTKYGDLCLHLAIENNACSSVCSEILEHYPLACAEKSRYGCYPLHLAILHELPSDLILRILRHHPQAVSRQISSTNNETCLHLAIERSMPQHIISALIEHDQKATMVMSRSLQLPLHLAVEQNLAPNLIRQIFNAGREAVLKLSRGTDHILHLAIRNKCDPEFIRDILDLSSSSAREPCSTGDLPLHMALQYKLPSDIVQLIFTAYEDAAMQPSREGSLPLVIALQESLDPNIICQLLNAFPEATAIKNRSGDYPLHVAIAHEQTSQVIINIFKTYECACRVKSSEGILPLFAAINLNLDMDVIYELAQGHRHDNIRSMLLRPQHILGRRSHMNGSSNNKIEGMMYKIAEIERRLNTRDALESRELAEPLGDIDFLLVRSEQERQANSVPDFYASSSGDLSTYLHSNNNHDHVEVSSNSRVPVKSEERSNKGTTTYSKIDLLERKINNLLDHLEVNDL